MICPNGTIPIARLHDMVYSKEYDVWFEPNDQPEDWDWKTKGIYQIEQKSQHEQV